MKATGILVKVRGDGARFLEGAAFGKTAKVEKILTVGSDGAELGIGGAGEQTWLRVSGRAGGENPWDTAHSAVSKALRGTGIAGGEVLSAEPDWQQRWSFDAPGTPSGPAVAARCTFEDQDGRQGRATGPGRAWNFGPTYSQLADARAEVGDRQSRIRIAHIDTGFDPLHSTVPDNVDLAAQRNFVAGQPSDDAVDRAPADGGPLTNRGHGTATLALLAGSRMKDNPDWPGFDDFIGGAPGATVVPIRIADGVAQFTTSGMVAGFDYACSIGAHVVSMSMGGLSSELLVDVINRAYDLGITVVSAAGNHYSGVPNPSTIVFPARYRRVIAACGIMADGRAYHGLQRGAMQASHGPSSKMATALGAFTPNVPWAQIDCRQTVHMWGPGTSSATPQIAAAAALWLAQHWDVVQKYPEPWMRVAAVREALFSSASKSTALMGAAETREKIGRGVLRAHDALKVKPPKAQDLVRLDPARASWPFLELLTGRGGVSVARTSGRDSMLRLELTQMAQRFASIDGAIADPDDPSSSPAPDARNRYYERALDEGEPSTTLRKVLEGLVGRPGRPTAVPPPKPVRRKVKTPPTPQRRLRVYALDPSIAHSNEFFAVNETTLSVPWDDAPDGEPLLPGPVGEYLEVVDVDPASDRVYDPVDLNEKTLLAQDGWAPSEGNPQFHQQMVYAVGMTTIGHFEQALGRRALWAPRPDPKTGRQRPVQRLRIYPHALREENAYYSPEKRALMFGYFPAQSKQGSAVAPGSMVFSCLSSDIIAHEMSHALLDGLHRRFTEASNPDVPAFHEAFADIVALFQHFTMRDLVRFEIGRARGELTAASLLGGLARQFGEGSGRRGPLRDYADPTVSTMDYRTTVEAHDRGSILVFAVYDAFLKIVARRTADLMRLATSGTGVLAPGALDVDLVNRLTDETCAVARHMLHVCIRALDYCPAVDITFGEYLRGLITADVDVMPVDRHGYRVALIEAFRNRGILPRDVRTVSEESLTWNTFFDPRPPWLPDLLASLDMGWNLDTARSRIMEINEENRWKAWSKLNQIFRQDPSVLAEFGLAPGIPRYDSSGRVRASRNKNAATTFDLFGIRPTRRVAEDGSFRTEIVAVIHQQQPLPVDGKDLANGFFWFRGGATVIIDPRKGREQIRFSIIKNSTSAARQERQRATAAAGGDSPLQRLYFGTREAEPFALMHGRRSSER